MRRDASAGERFDWLPSFVLAAASDTGVMPGKSRGSGGRAPVEAGDVFGRRRIAKEKDGGASPKAGPCSSVFSVFGMGVCESSTDLILSFLTWVSVC